MSATVTLFTDTPEFERLWRPALTSVGLAVRTSTPDRLATHAVRNEPVVVDASAAAYDEDELLAAVGFARALGAIPVVHLPADRALAAVEHVVEEMCDGLVARRDDDVRRLGVAMARRLDRDRNRRFEFVTVSPRDGELLAILGDGRCELLERPVDDGDDGTEVVSIDLAEDATFATLGLASGANVTLRAESVQSNGAGHAESAPIDGARLGARLRALRLEAGLTQAELARRTGIHRPNIARVEAGRHTPSLETLSRLAIAIGVPTTRVLSED